MFRSCGGKVTCVTITTICIFSMFILLKSNLLHNKVIVSNVPISQHLPGWQYFVQSGMSAETSPPVGDNNTLICQVPRLSIKTDMNKEHFSVLPPLNCTENRLFHLINSHLQFRKDLQSVDRTVHSCDYRAIDRVTDDTFAYSNRLRRLDNFEVKIKHDFFTVECYEGKPTHAQLTNESNALELDPGAKIVTNATSLHPVYDEIDLKPKVDFGSINSQLLSFVKHLRNQDRIQPDYHQFFAQIHPKKEVLDRVSRTQPFINSTQLNVLILSLDSMSHLSYKRIMPLSYEFLAKSLGAVIMNSYNIVGDGTLAAFIPLLTGKTEAELPNIRHGLFSQYADSYPLIWKNYTESGYVTMYGEDRPDIETFQMRMNGFDQCPVDHYIRQFWQAVFDSNEIYRKNPWFLCLDGIPRHQYTLDYVRDYFVKYPDVPKFAFQHIVALPHYTPNQAQYIDKDLRDLMVYLNDAGHLDNTLLIVMSDHGSRYNWMRRTIQGKLEERLPMMALRFPQSFQNKYPNLLRNLRVNAERLSTPFDIHETLQTVLNIHKSEIPVIYTDRGISLLKEIPINRTCASAGVDIHWCTCLQYQKLDPTGADVQRLGNYLVTHINSKVSDLSNLCAELHLKTILDVQLIHPNKQLLKFSEHKETFFKRTDYFKQNAEVDSLHYQVTIETSPSGGLYEATLRGLVKHGTLEVLGDVSRINKYGDQPKCIIEKYPNLRKYCFCRI